MSHLLLVASSLHVQGWRHEFESGGGSMRWKMGGGVNIVKILQFEKGVGYMTPPAPMMAPSLYICTITLRQGSLRAISSLL